MGNTSQLATYMQKLQISSGAQQNSERYYERPSLPNCKHVCYLAIKLVCVVSLVDIHTLCGVGEGNHTTSPADFDAKCGPQN